MIENEKEIQASLDDLLSKTESVIKFWWNSDTYNLDMLLTLEKTKVQILNMKRMVEAYCRQRKDVMTPHDCWA